MFDLFGSLIASLKVKLSAPLRRLTLLFSATYWSTIIRTKLRKLFFKLFNVRPRDHKDYYSIFSWLVSKRLAFAIVVILGIACGYYVISATPVKAWVTGDKGDGIPTYVYDALPLRFMKGRVRILAGDRTVGYVGEVAKGYCKGSGLLYNKNGTKRYEGLFADSKYNGAGTLYYPSGGRNYVGDFRDNIFHGKGDFYRPTGTMEYSGDYNEGKRSGMGKLYDESENQYFSGAFLDDRIVYQQFLEKPTTAIAEMYTGKGNTYSSTNEYCVQMPEIGAVYAVTDGSHTLSGNWIVDSIAVLESAFIMGDGKAETFTELTQLLGEPDYQGTTSLMMTEAVALNLLNEQSEKSLGAVEMETTASFDNVFDVTSYNRDMEIYIYSYKVDGLLYTFFAGGATDKGFVMYTIESIK